MDHGEEQAMEMEALEAILGEDGLQRYTGSVPTGWDTEKGIHKVKLEPETNGSDTAASCDLLFQYTDQYPEELPNLKVSNTRGLTNADGAALLEVLQCAAQDNIGMASIFAVMQAGKDWLESKAGLEEVVGEAVLAKQAAEAEERRRAERRAQGTPVTKESFESWAKRFQAEIEQAEAAGERPIKGDKGAERRGMTGKEWFLEKHKTEGEGGEDELEQELALLGMEDEDGGGSDGSFVDEDEDSEDEDEDFLDEYLARAEEEEEEADETS